MFFGTYKIQAIRKREQDGRHEILMTNQTEHGLHTLVLSYDESERDPRYAKPDAPVFGFPTSFRLEGYGFVEASKKFTNPRQT